MKIVFICPYFGKLPNYFPIWLKTCEHNQDIDWIIFTDDESKYNYPNNVKVNYIKFEDFKNYIKKQLEIEINIEKPYKLCDFKPLYGDIFKEYIKKYDFWGHCDIDCIFGNIRKFITEDILAKYDKILFLGHMTLYRNSKKINERYKIHYGGMDYKTILNKAANYAFDESFTSISINTIYKENRFPVFMQEIYFDICPLYYDFKKSYYINEKPVVEKNKHYIFEWNNGTLISKIIDKGEVKEKEYAYIHFQKRKIKNEIQNLNQCQHFIFVPNKFFEVSNELKYEEIVRHLNNKKIFYSVYFKQRYRNLKFKLKLFLRRR